MTPFSMFVLNENVLTLDKDVRAFDHNAKKLSQEEASSRLNKILDRYQEEMLKARDTLKSILKKSSDKGKADILYGMKPVSSIIDKVINRGKPLQGLADLIRGAILFDTQEQLDSFVKDFQRKNSDIIVKHEKKEKGGDQKYGYYGSHHFDLLINGFIVELQAMTKNLWKFKKPAHDIYNRTRSSDILNPEDRMLSFKLFKLGNTKKMREDVLLEMAQAEFSYEEYTID